MQTPPTMCATIDDGDASPELRSGYRRPLPTRTAADDQQVVVVPGIAHDRSLTQIAGVGKPYGGFRGRQCAGRVRLRTFLANLGNAVHRRTQVAQPGVGVPPYQLDAPAERVAARTGNARVHERVEDLPLRLPQPGHHRRGQRGEDARGVCADHAPGDLSGGGMLDLSGDADPGVASVDPELLDPPSHRGGLLVRRDAVGGLGLTDPTDDDDLVAVDRHGRLLGEPVLRQPACQPAPQLFG